jgi:hypothetical protein
LHHHHDECVVIHVHPISSTDQFIRRVSNEWTVGIDRYVRFIITGRRPNTGLDPVGRNDANVRGTSMIGVVASPMVLYHVTRKDRVAKIRREGLKPHVPGKVWGEADPSITGGKPVVWLTADPHSWRHIAHPNKAFRNPDTVLLKILINWRAPKLRHYMSWFDPQKKQNWLYCQNNPAAWFVYFGKIGPSLIVDGLERPRRRNKRRSGRGIS